VNRHWGSPIIVPILAICAALTLSFAPPQKPGRSIFLEDLTWVEAEGALKNYEVVLIALGARSKEHGPHLPLNTDYILAEYLKNRVMEAVPVVVLPTLEYGFYPSFLEYPGSVSISEETFKNTILDICDSISRYGPKNFYVLNTGISTIRPLEQARKELEVRGKILRYLDLKDVDKKLPLGLLKQSGGSHADEAETSMMLYIAPEKVNMHKAVKDYDPRPGRRGLTRNPKGEGTYSPSGIWGDPTLATKEKGRTIAEATVAEIISQIGEMMRDWKKAK
jgi:creatinine amidohydrolase